jgi:hypothetical protein
MSWACSTCGEVHEDLPFSFAADYPDHYANLTTEDRESRTVIGTDQCIIDQKEFYIRGCLEIPIQDEDRIFLWGLWAAMREEDFDEVSNSWETQGRENRFGPYKGRLANGLMMNYYPPALNLKLTIRLGPVGQRPLFSIDEPEHPLAIAQRDGMTLLQAVKLATDLLHAH